MRPLSFACRAAPLALLLLSSALVACGGGGGDDDNEDDGHIGPTPPPALSIVGRGAVTDRYTAEVSVRGDYAYTTTWSTRGATGVGNVINVWNVSGATPTLVRSITVSDATTLGDVQVSDDGKLLVVATERANGSLVVFDLTSPGNPVQVSRYLSPNTTGGVHTAEVQRVNGKLYAFLSVDPSSSSPSRLTIVDLSVPAAPVEVFSQVMGSPFIHDVFVRDGILFTALWNAGLTLWDVGGGGRGGTPAAPVEIGNVRTVNGEVHNVWWFHDPATGAKRYAFVGEEGPAQLFTSSSGDIHVVDVSDMAAPREVAFYHVANAGTHNFWMNEAEGILYAAFYNAGVEALDVRGDLGACTAAQKSADGRCDLGATGRRLASGPTGQGAVFIWGVQGQGDYVYASDMLNGLWKLNRARR
jgi:hypothetical protein